MKQHAQEDQLATLAAAAREDHSRNLMSLDLQAYWNAVRLGTPLPMFAPLNQQGFPDKRATRHLPTHKIQHVVASPLSPEFYEAAHQVDRIIVQDVRRRLR